MESFTAKKAEGLGPASALAAGSKVRQRQSVYNSEACLVNNYFVSWNVLFLRRLITFCFLIENVPLCFFR